MCGAKSSGLSSIGVFQMHYYGDAMAIDKNAREIYRGHKWFDSCEKFCERWDQMSFDPDYTSYPLAHFELMIREIFTHGLPFDRSIFGDVGPEIMPKTFLIGANHGIGLEMTRQAVARGDRVLPVPETPGCHLIWWLWNKRMIASPCLVLMYAPRKT